MIALTENECDCPVNLRISSAASLVCRLSSIAEACQHQTMLDPVRLLFVLRQPSNGTNGSWYEQKAVRVASRGLGEEPGHRHGHGHAGEVVIAQRGMADVTRDQHLIVFMPGKHKLAICKMPVRKGRINAHRISATFAERLELSLRDAESPCFAIVRRLVGDPVRVRRD